MYTIEALPQNTTVETYFSRVAAQTFEDLSFQPNEVITVAEVGIIRTGSAVAAYTCKLTGDPIAVGDKCPTLVVKTSDGAFRSISGLKNHKVTIVANKQSYPLKEEGMALVFKPGATFKVAVSLNEVATASSNAALKAYWEKQPGGAANFKPRQVNNVTISLVA